VLIANKDQARVPHYHNSMASGTRSGALFPGASQCDQFRGILHKIVQEHREEILRMGIDPDDIGVHSIRKGSATYCTNGTTTGIREAWPTSATNTQSGAGAVK